MDLSHIYLAVAYPIFLQESGCLNSLHFWELSIIYLLQEIVQNLAYTVIAYRVEQGPCREVPVMRAGFSYENLGTGISVFFTRTGLQCTKMYRDLPAWPLFYIPCIGLQCIKDVDQFLVNSSNWTINISQKWGAVGNKYLVQYSAAPYLVGVLGVPEHPRNLGVHKRGKAWILLIRD